MIEQEVVEKLERWVANHPTPDKPLLCEGHKSYSPNQIVEEVRKGSELGEEFYRRIGEGGLDLNGD